LETTSAAAPASGEPTRRPPLWQIAAVFAEISITAFGGAQTVRMRRSSVRERGWLTEDGFLEVLSIANVVPGPNPVNTATLIGLRVGGVPGAVVAFLACTFPAFFILLGVGWLLATYPSLTWLHGAVVGCAAAAVGMTAANAIEMSKRFFGKAVELSFVAVTFASVLAMPWLPIWAILLGYVPVSMLIRLLITRRTAAA
jgi:chromate transporter